MCVRFYTPSLVFDVIDQPNIQHVLWSIEECGKRRRCVDPEAADRTGLLRQMSLKFGVAHCSKLADILIKVQTNPAIGLVWIDTDADDRSVIRSSAEELG